MGPRHAPSGNFENVISQIAGNCISALMSNLIILFFHYTILIDFNKLTPNARYLYKGDALLIKIRMPL